MDKIEKYITAEKLRFAKILGEFIEQAGISETGEGIRASYTFIIQLLEKLLHAKVKVYPTTTSPVIVATIEPGKQRTILMYAHYDVMAAGNLDEWQSDPFKLIKRKEKFYGRGTGDDKGQLIAQICGLYVYQRLYGHFPVTIKLFYEGQEEAGSIDLQKIVHQLRDTDLRGVKNVVVSDGAYNGHHMISLGNRGGLGFRLTVKENDSDLHSGNFGNVAPNAALKLVQLLNRLVDPTTGIARIPGFYDGIKQASDEEKKIIAELPKPLTHYYSAMEYYQRLMFYPTININGISSGHVGKRIKTIIPGKATVQMDIRLVKGQSIKQIKWAIENLFINEMARGIVKIEWLVETPPSKVDITSSFLQLLQEAVTSVTGRCLLQPVMPGTVPNYVWEKELGADVFTIPLANSDHHAHAANENIAVKDFFDRIAIYAYFCQKLGDRFS